MKFIKLVYLVFTIMILFTLIFVVIVMQTPEINRFQWKYWPVLIVAIVLIITIEIMLFCCISVSRSSPLNVILLIVFVIAFAYLIGFVCYFYTPELILIALVITIAGFLGMTIYAFVTPYDITIWGSVLFGVSIAFLVLVIVGIIVRCKVLTLIICFIGVTLGLIYVAYDT